MIDGRRVQLWEQQRVLEVSYPEDKSNQSKSDQELLRTETQKYYRLLSQEES
jgi:hypothetical protein